VGCSPVVLATIQGTESTQSRHVRTEYRTWGKKLIDNDNVIGNWPAKTATTTIPIRSKTIGDSLSDDYRAILLALLEEKEEQRLYVGKRPEGMHASLCFSMAHSNILSFKVWIGLSNESMVNASYVLSIGLSTLLRHSLPTCL
jgi:hypothetical protein